MTDLYKIFDIPRPEELERYKKELEVVKTKPKREKKEFSEDQKKELLDRLRYGKQKAAEKRALESGKPLEPKPVKENKKADIVVEQKTETKTPEPKTPEPKFIEKIVETVKYKNILELDDDPEINHAELKQFLTKFYKASKSQAVKNALEPKQEPVKAEPPKQEPVKAEPKPEPIPEKPVNTILEKKKMQMLNHLKKYRRY